MQSQKALGEDGPSEKIFPRKSFYLDWINLKLRHLPSQPSAAIWACCIAVACDLLWLKASYSRVFLPLQLLGTVGVLYRIQSLAHSFHITQLLLGCLNTAIITEQIKKIINAYTHTPEILNYFCDWTPKERKSVRGYLSRASSCIKLFIFIYLVGTSPDVFELLASNGGDAAQKINYFYEQLIHNTSWEHWVLPIELGYVRYCLNYFSVCSLFLYK